MMTSDPGIHKGFTSLLVVSLSKPEYRSGWDHNENTNVVTSFEGCFCPLYL